MSPESYVLLLISCWLLLASALLWGMLRIGRRHYPTVEQCEAQNHQADQMEAAALVAQRTRQAQPRKLRNLPQLHPGHFARSFGMKRRLGC